MLITGFGLFAKFLKQLAGISPRFILLLSTFSSGLSLVTVLGRGRALNFTDRVFNRATNRYTFLAHSNYWYLRTPVEVAVHGRLGACLFLSSFPISFCVIDQDNSGSGFIS